MSQGISNVPAAILLENFTDDWRGLAWGVNVEASVWPSVRWPASLHFAWPGREGYGESFIAGRCHC
ncbi:hypothetical protein [Halomonas sp. BC04]|uniref:hypothetical protein n=1 Tax=Halomonas sp. BC04 TaxID=1403540 RepID=UPI0003ED60C6|nr:hypothetical protein [Halomonas sp. BC04]EWG98450.1 hypothetical protein Q427_30485 [Halomonas sp. BC04]